MLQQHEQQHWQQHWQRHDERGGSGGGGVAVEGVPPPVHPNERCVLYCTVRARSQTRSFATGDTHGRYSSFGDNNKKQTRPIDASLVLIEMARPQPQPPAPSPGPARPADARTIRSLCSRSLANNRFCLAVLFFVVDGTTMTMNE
jgi:hypothetical protein